MSEGDWVLGQNLPTPTLRMQRSGNGGEDREPFVLYHNCFKQLHILSMIACNI